jgi:sugar lactone lactonase YvrE
MKKNFFLPLFLILFSITTFSAEPSIWSVNSREDALKGNSKGVTINDNGSISLAPKISEVFNTGQPFIWASAYDKSGNFFLGTGGDGKIFKVDQGGKGTLFYDSTELNVSALATSSDGSVFAGTSPDGKVYRISPNGNASVYFEPKQKYIWSLEVLNDGSLIVGTGETGKIFKVKTANADPQTSLLFDTSETHIISLASDAKGNVYAGTDSEGLVLRFSSEGKPFGLLDSPLREIRDLTVGVDGSLYVLALSESASTKEKKKDDTKTENTTVSVDKNPAAANPASQKSRYDLTGAKSAVYRILPDGGNDIIWKSDDITAFSVYAHLTGNGVLIGTSDKGRIYSVSNNGDIKNTLQTDEEQVSTISTYGNSLFATSSNQGKFFRFGGQSDSDGIYESPVLDAKSVASWGTIWWRASGNVQIQTRSGNSALPNESWTDWSSAYTNSKGTKINSPKAQFLQWRAVLKSSSENSILNEVNVSFLPRNISPEILSITILPTNVGLAPNPPVPVDPNVKALGLDPADFGIVIPPAIPRKVFQSGAKSLMWKAEDRNGDDLIYSIYYRQVEDSDFKLLRDNLTQAFFTIDGLALGDGRYVFKIVASDSPSNPQSQALQGDRISEPFNIDNTPPKVTVVGKPEINGENVRIIFDVAENSSRLIRAEYNVDGDEWKTVFAEDGISDSQNERYTVNLIIKNSGEYSVALRVFDSSGNTGNTRVTIKK